MICVVCGKTKTKLGNEECGYCRRERIRRERLENGLCHCGRPVIEGRKTCKECAEHSRAWQKNMTAKCKSEGICIKCKHEKADEGYSTCAACREQGREVEHLKRKKWVDNNLCVKCGKEPVDEYAQCEKCRKASNERYRKRRDDMTDLEAFRRNQKQRVYQNARYRMLRVDGYCVRCAMPMKFDRALCDECYKYVKSKAM